MLDETHVSQFPKQSAQHRARLLTRPARAPRVIIDTDAANEIDDQYALAWALLSPERLHLEGVTAVPFSFAHHREGLIAAYDKFGATSADDTQEEFMGGLGGWARRLHEAGRDPRDIHFSLPDEGAELSYLEILRVFEKCAVNADGLVYRGSPAYLSKLDEPLDTPAARFIVDRARQRDRGPVYVLAMGALTNIASALLMAPDIVDNVVVVWTAGFPSYAPFSNAPSLNLVQDPLSSQLLFACGVPIVYLPGYHVGAQLKLSLPEMERFVEGRGAIGNYLHRLYTHNPLHEMFAISAPESKTWVIWDVINVAWLFDDGYVTTATLPCPALDDELCWKDAPGGPSMLEAYDLNRDAIFEDLYASLERAP